MPYYEYECKKCGAVFNVIQHMDDEPLKRHSEMIDDLSKQYGYYPHDKDCDGILEKKINIPSLRFIGPGFYVNDYKGK
jgi:putative FmdB family regulatory protein